MVNVPQGLRVDENIDLIIKNVPGVANFTIDYNILLVELIQVSGQYCR